MARLLEHHAKELLRRYGVPVPAFEAARTPKEAADAAARIGLPVALKALVPVGGRGKRGAVSFAEDLSSVREEAARLLRMTVGAFPVREILIERKVAPYRELYVALTFDPTRGVPVLMASPKGGIDVEERPEDLLTVPLDPLMGLPSFLARRVASDMGLKGKGLLEVARVLEKLYSAFGGLDAYILEVNPLALTEEGEALALSALLGVDEEALGRHPELLDKAEPGSDRTWRPLTERERELVALDAKDPYRGTARYTELEGGDIGFFCGGGGGSLLMFDALKRLGGRPANYTEFGGNPTEEKVYGVVKGILTKPGVRGLFLCVNITNNTQTDLVAAGVLRALRDLKLDPGPFPVVMRLAGVNESKAQELLAGTGIEYHGDDLTMEEAAQRMLERMTSLSGAGRP